MYPYAGIIRPVNPSQAQEDLSLSLTSSHIRVRGHHTARECKSSSRGPELELTAVSRIYVYDVDTTRRAQVRNRESISVTQNKNAETRAERIVNQKTEKKDFSPDLCH